MTTAALDGSAMIPDELVDEYIAHLSWTDQTSERDKALVEENIRVFAAWLRENMYGMYGPIYKIHESGGSE